MKINFLRSLGALMVFALVGSVSAFSFPSQVTGVRAVPVGETEVQVSWEEATSAEDIIIGYRLYYGLASVQEENANYDDDLFVSGRRSITVGDLQPGTDYYFAVTAIDSEENESELYSIERKLTTKGIKYVEPEPEPEPTCDDGILNGEEEDVDCGGDCEACFVEEEIIEDPIIIEEPEIVIQEPVIIEEPEILIEEPEIFGPEIPEYLRPAAPDVVAPIEAMHLDADLSQMATDAVTVLSWTKSLNVDGDVADQVLYVRKNTADWDNGYSIGKDLEMIEIDAEKGATYEYKIVTIDAAGNESESRSYSFTTELAQSGPAGVMGIAVAIFILFGLGVMTARRRS